MHYQNGREAKNGDIIVMFPKPSGTPIVGVLYGAVAGNDACNGYLAAVRLGQDHYANLSECLRIDDVREVVSGQVPDQSKIAAKVAE